MKPLTFHVTTAAWHKARQRAGIEENVTLHTMRHCSNSWLAQRNVPREIRARLGGWSLGKDAIDGYTHLYIEHLRPFAAMLDEILGIHVPCTATGSGNTFAPEVPESIGVADGIRTHNNWNHNLVVEGGSVH